VKQYHHYAYKMEAAPPFRICSVSKEITLVTRKKEAPPGQRQHKRGWTHQRIWKDTSQTAYISGLFLDGDSVLLSYGSSDIDARLLTMSTADLEGLFAGSPFDCSGATVVDAGSGEKLPHFQSSALRVGLAVNGSSGGNGSSAGDEYRRQHFRQHRRVHRRERSSA